MDIAKRTKRVLVVTPSLDGFGGVANYYKIVLPLLRASNFSIDHLVIGSAQCKKGLFYPIADQIRFHQKTRRGYELIHVNPSLYIKSFIRDGLLIQQAKRNGIPVIVFFRGWDKRFAQRVESFLPLFRFIYGKSDSFIVLASEFKHKLRSWGIKAPIYIQTTTVDQNLLDGFDIEQKIINLFERKKIRILYLARLDRAKGIFETIDAVKKLREKQISVDLTIAGDGPERQLVKDYVQGIDSLSGSVEFLGYIRGQDKANAFANHDIYCFPSYGEGMPNSVLEALAFGMPVITCPVGGLRDVFDDEKMGAFVPPGSPEAIADKIEQYCLNRDEMVNISRFNFQYAKAFLAPNVAEKILDIYAEVFNSF